MDFLVPWGLHLSNFYVIMCYKLSIFYYVLYNRNLLVLIIQSLRHFTILGQKNAKYVTLLHCRTGQKYGRKRSDKMAPQNEPNFAFINWNNKSLIR